MGEKKIRIKLSLQGEEFQTNEDIESPIQHVLYLAMKTDGV